MEEKHFTPFSIKVFQNVYSMIQFLNISFRTRFQEYISYRNELSWYK